MSGFVTNPNHTYFLAMVEFKKEIFYDITQK